MIQHTMKKEVCDLQSLTADVRSNGLISQNQCSVMPESEAGRLLVLLTGSDELHDR